MLKYWILFVKYFWKNKTGQLYYTIQNNLKKIKRCFKLKINEKQYKKLVEKARETEFEKLSFDSRFQVNPVINEHIEENRLLFDLLRKLDWKILEKEYREYPIMDHSIYINSTKSFHETEGLQGIISFPYNDINVFERLHSENWMFYVVNPLLFNYNCSTVGILMVPSSYDQRWYNDWIVSDFSSFIQGLTGYPLFFEYTTDEIDEIKEVYPDLSDEEFHKSILRDDYSEKYPAFKEIFEFWLYNDEVKEYGLDKAYENFKKNCSYTWSTSIIQTLESDKPFSITFDDGTVYGGLKRCELDIIYDINQDDETFDEAQKLFLENKDKIGRKRIEQGWLYTTTKNGRKNQIKLSALNSVHLMLGMFKLEMEE